MSHAPGFARRLAATLSDPVAAILAGLAAGSALSRIWLLLAHRFR